MKLDLAEQTVKNHLSNIRRKYGARSTLQAIYQMWRQDSL